MRTLVDLRRGITMTGAVLCLFAVRPCPAEALTTISLQGRTTAALDDAADQSHGSVATGDFNGDGRPDLAVYRSHWDVRDVNLFLGGTNWGGRPFAEARSLRILLSESPTTVPSPHLTFGDVNGDGKDDLLFVGSTVSGATPQYVNVLFGRASPPALVDLRHTAPDVRISGTFQYLSPPLSVGDLTGDGVADIVVMGMTDAYVVRGSTGLVPGTAFDVSEGTRVIRLGSFPSTATPNYIRHRIADVDGDGGDDLLLCDPYRERSAGNVAGAVYVFRGRSDWPNPWNVSATPPDVTLLGGGAGVGLIKDLAGVGDFNGDLRADLLVAQHLSSGATIALGMIDGATLWSRRPSVDMKTAPIAWAHCPSFDTPLIFYSHVGVVGDFDGDGAADLFSKGDGASLVAGDVRYGLLSSQKGGGLLGADVSEADVLMYYPNYGGNSGEVMADINGDGRDDLVAYVEPFPHMGSFPAATYGEVHVVYGFRPLTNPSVTITRRSAATRRINLTLHVDGDPVEMMLSGDVDASVRDQWRPYQTATATDWTSSPGAKTLRVKFRNAVGQESDWAQAVDAVTVSRPGLTVVTNRLRPGRTIRFDLGLTQDGPVRAVVYDGRGATVSTLYDGPAAPGILSLEWNGTNAAGGRAAPGIYVLLVESAAGRDQTRLVVE
jgi:hypothetical protein